MTELREMELAKVIARNCNKVLFEDKYIYDIIDLPKLIKDIDDYYEKIYNKGFGEKIGV